MHYSSKYFLLFVRAGIRRVYLYLCLPVAESGPETTAEICGDVPGLYVAPTLLKKAGLVPGDIYPLPYPSPTMPGIMGTAIAAVKSVNIAGSIRPAMKAITSMVTAKSIVKTYN